MSGEDVEIHYDDLKSLSDMLSSIIYEFDHAEDREHRLQDAIDKPYGKDDLHDLAHDFEGNWDDRRNRLKKDLGEVRDRVDATVSNFQDGDKKMGSSISTDSGTPAPGKK